MLLVRKLWNRTSLCINTGQNVLRWMIYTGRIVLVHVPLCVTACEWTVEPDKASWLAWWHKRVTHCLTPPLPHVLQVWDAGSGSLLQKLPADLPVLDISPFTVNGEYFLASLTEKMLKLYRWEWTRISCLIQKVKPQRWKMLLNFCLVIQKESGVLRVMELKKHFRNINYQTSRQVCDAISSTFTWVRG